MSHPSCWREAAVPAGCGSAPACPLLPLARGSAAAALIPLDCCPAKLPELCFAGSLRCAVITRGCFPCTAQCLKASLNAKKTDLSPLPGCQVLCSWAQPAHQWRGGLDIRATPWIPEWWGASPAQAQLWGQGSTRCSLWKYRTLIYLLLPASVVENNSPCPGLVLWAWERAGRWLPFPTHSQLAVAMAPVCFHFLQAQPKRKAQASSCLLVCELQDSPGRAHLHPKQVWAWGLLIRPALIFGDPPAPHHVPPCHVFLLLCKEENPFSTEACTLLVLLCKVCWNSGWGSLAQDNASLSFKYCPVQQSHGLCESGHSLFSLCAAMLFFLFSVTVFFLSTCIILWSLAITAGKTWTWFPFLSPTAGTPCVTSLAVGTVTF